MAGNGKIKDPFGARKLLKPGEAGKQRKIEPNPTKKELRNLSANDFIAAQTVAGGLDKRNKILRRKAAAEEQRKFREAKRNEALQDLADFEKKRGTLHQPPQGLR